MKIKNIIILLDGPIKNDGRVRRVIESLSSINKIFLYYVNGEESDKSIFNENCKLFTFNMVNKWIYKNLFFNKCFSEMENELLKFNEKIDIIYCNDYPLLATAIRLKNLHPNSKLYYDSHEIYIETINQFFPLKGWKKSYGIPLVYINKLYHSLLETSQVKNIDLLITVCDNFKFYFEKKYNLSNITVVRNCPTKNIEVNNNNNNFDLLNISKNDFIILYQGALNNGRGIEKLFESSVYFESQIKFIIIGEGPNYKMYKQNASLMKYDNIYFLGKIAFEKLLDYTSHAHLGLLLIQSINESKKLTLPNKIFEYMTASIPVLSNNLPEATSIINECNCGFIIDDSDPKDIANTINNLSRRKEDLKILGENGRKAYEQKYNWENEIEKLLQIINK